MLQKKILFALAAVAVLPITAKTANADSYSISNNGDNASSSLSVSQSQQNNVSQNNNAEVTNQVEANVDTGNNSTGRNTGGENSIQTGDSTVTTSVQNAANQSNVDSSTCCQQSDSQASIIGNGSDTTNNISYSSNNNNTVVVNQQATITNSIFGNINTGGNTANQNNGKVTINTGSITVNEIINNSVNHSQVALATGSEQGFSLKISGNGEGSTNTVTLNQDSNAIVVVNNAADIFNYSVWNLITGNNKANGNNGDVSIKTGDVSLNILINNDLNINEVKVDCGCKETPPPPPPPPPPCDGDGCNPPPPPPPPPSDKQKTGDGGSNPSNPPGGSVLGTTTGAILPTTGTPWMLLALIGNLLMLFFGAVLRLKSGRSPSLVLAL